MADYVEVTEAMVEAGYRVLMDAVDGTQLFSATRLLKVYLSDVFRAMEAARQPSSNEDR